MASTVQSSAMPAALLSALQLPSALPCSVCHRAAECKRCGGCNSVWYCGRDCQRRDWQGHKSLCQHLQEVKRWSAFSEHLGGQFSRADDLAYAKAPRDLSSLPMLPHLVLGTVASSLPGQVYLSTWRFSHERPGNIPMYIMSEDLRGVETNPEILQASFRQLLGNQSLESVIKSGVPVAVKRSFLHESGFQLPSVVHTARTNCPFGSEQCVFVLPAAASAADRATAAKRK